MSTPTDSATDDRTAEQPPAAGAYEPRRPPLRRAYHGRMVAGVAAGLADYLAVDVTVIRVAFAVLAVLGGAAFPVYLACLLLIPEEGSDQSIVGALLDSGQHGNR